MKKRNDNPYADDIFIGIITRNRYAELFTLINSIDYPVVVVDTSTIPTKIWNYNWLKVI